MTSISNGHHNGTRLTLSQRPKIGEETARIFRERIVSGEYPPGKHMRVDELADDLGVSTMPVREALAALSAEGLVEGYPHRGFKVVSISPDDILDLFSVHAFCAATLGRRAAGRISDEDLAELRSIQDEIGKVAVSTRGSATRRSDRIEDLNFRFHRIINHVADARRLRWFLSMSTRFIPRRYYMTQGWVPLTVHDHGPIIAALSAGDGDQVYELMQAHILEGGRLIVEGMERAGYWPKAGSTPG